MIEFNVSSLFWMAMGGIITFMGFVVISLCRAAGFCSRLEEHRQDMLLVENWNARRQPVKAKGGKSSV